MSREYVVDISRDVVPNASITGLNLTGKISLPGLVQLALLLVLLIQVGYYLWKWRSEYLDKRRSHGVEDEGTGSCVGNRDAGGS